MTRREAIVAMGAAVVTPVGASKVNIENGIIKHQPVVRIGLPNKNKRVYSQKNADTMLAACGPDGYVYGHLGSATSSVVEFSRVSHRCKLYQEGNTVYADVEILNTDCGKQLRHLIGLGQKMDFRTTGVGYGKVDEDGILHIGEDYKLVSVDAVRDGS